ncbi:MAG: RiPP maturation radical SAM C-methyltransferase, partial [Stellaceae bacterium]
IFSGEAESSFRQFVHEFTAGLHRTVREEPAIIASAEPTRELDGVPLPAYEDFFSQFAATLALTSAGRELNDKIWLPYETSRGCWWGQKHHCTFCGLNAEGMAFRSKSADRVFEDLESLHSGYARDRILMVDNIMPHRYFATLLPRLAEADKKLRIFYEQKANLSWRRMKLLCDAGVWRIQPGIEALHSKLLAHMDKGVTAPQNINCLRYARAVGLDVAWNLLVDFPGDDPDWYLATAELLPLLTHLQPPSGISPLSIDRFSPYFDRPDHYGIARLKPIPAYALAYGSDHDIRDVAYHFQGDYESATRSSPEVTQQLNSRVEEWRLAWSGDVKPLLQVFPLAGDRYLLIDTRPGARTDAQIIDSTQAAQALGGAKPTVATAEWEASQQWARDGGYAVDIDGHLVPLAIASRGCLDSFDVR